MKVSAPLVLVAMLGLLGCPPSNIAPPPVPITGPAPAPAPSDPDSVTDGDITVAYENGLRIIVKHVPSAELVSMQLYILGGARFRTKDNAGLEALALRTAVTGGTVAMDKDVVAKKLSKLGSTLGASSYHGYSVVAAKSLTEELTPTFELMVSAFLQPALPDSELTLHQQRMLVGIKRRDVTPDGKLHQLVVKAMYSGHPFENLADGNIASVEAATVDAIRKHLEGLRNTSRLELVVVGNVKADNVRELVRKQLSKLPRGTYAPPPIPVPTFKQATVSVTADTLPTNYIEASFMGPSWNAPDFAASILAMRILQARVFEEVRTKRNLSYAPSARYRWSGDISRGSLYVTAVKANDAMTVMFNEARRLKTELVPARVLAGAKSVFLTGHLMGNESTNGQANWLAICDIVGGDWKLSRTLPDQIKAVTAEDVEAFAKKYIHTLQTVVVGDPEVIDLELFKSL